MEWKDILQMIEGLDEAGMAKASCYLSIEKRNNAVEMEEVAYALTINAEIALCLTPEWAIVDLSFNNHLDSDLFEYVEVCKKYYEIAKSEEEYSDYTLALTIAPKGNYEYIMIGRNCFWSLISEEVGECSKALRFIFSRADFGLYELSDEAVEDMVNQAILELDE